MTMHVARKAACRSFSILLLLLLLPGASPLQAMEREKFGELLQMIPPDGMASRYGDIFIHKSGEGASQMPPAFFPHWLHRANYTCSVCHTELGFSFKSGETRISRSDYLAGRYCGACHDGKTAFSGRRGKDRHCERCHVEKRGILDQRFREFAQDLPQAGFGNRIDWVRALDEGLISPRSGLATQDRSLPLPAHLQNPLPLKASSPRSESPFPHDKHVAWIDCSGCHPHLFNIKQSGTELFSMEKNLYGWFCGTCHLRVSFSMLDCSRCHPYIKSHFR